ncbi:flocculation protein FLO11-like [Syngnathus acus]|uniref:flocculation protein FLO11-like n=1 Tax=Syngnathus acus TaxID=161584 RepID=UPI001886144E|nr:flocculation protein FLO11-like [Syngnathus acus]
MKLTALYTFLTLLASSTLSWEGNDGLGQCVGTVRARGPCGLGRTGCPYVLSLPPMTVHLPEQFRELEKLVKDLQTLKDDVDQLRKMCGDCGKHQESRYGEEGHSQTQRLGQRDLEDGDGQDKTILKETVGKVEMGESERAEDHEGEKESQDHQMWPDETNAMEKKTHIKKAQDRGRQDQEKIWEEKKEEMEKGINAGQSNEKLKQTENRGLADKSKSIKKDEEVVVEKKDGGIGSLKTERGKEVENVQRDSNGESASRKATQTTDFVSISPTPALTFISAQRPELVDLDETERITSSLPTLPFSSSTSNYLPVINTRRTQTTLSDSNTIRNQLDVTSPPRSSSTSNFLHHSLHTTISPEATESSSSRWPSTNTGLKHRPGLKTKTAGKHTPGMKPDANDKPKDFKHDRKVDIKIKQKTAPQKNKAEIKLKPGNDTKRFHVQRADNRTSDPHGKTQKPKHGQDRTTNLLQVATDQHGRSATNAEPKSEQIPTLNKNVKPNKRPVPVKTSKTDQKPKPDKKLKTNTTDKFDQNKAKQHFPPDSKKRQKLKEIHSNSTGNSESETTFTANPNRRLESSQKIPIINRKAKAGQVPKLNQKQSQAARDQNGKANLKPTANQVRLDPDRQSVSTQSPGEESDNKSQLRSLSSDRPPTRLMPEPGATPTEPNQNTTTPKPQQWIRTTTSNFHNAHVPPTPSPVSQTAVVTHSQADTKSKPSTTKPITPKTFKGLSRLPVGLNSEGVSDLRPQSTGKPSSIPKSTQPIVTHSVIPSTNPGSTKTNLHARADAADLQKTIQPLSPTVQTTTSSDFSSTTTTTTTHPEARPVAESSTSSARELRVKIKQVAAAFFNGSQLGPNGRHSKDLPERNEGESRPASGSMVLIPSEGAVSALRRDCSDHQVRGRAMKSGIYRVTPDLHTGRSFPVLCDMEVQGGGWTLLQLRQDGSVSFNRTWAEYRSGFGKLLSGGEFWLGNEYIHLLTRGRDMTLRVELQDLSGVARYAEYEHFRVASERMRYRLTVGGYSGTAGDALRFSSTYDHNNQAFTTPDRDNDRYPSGNCGAYYSSGWWFDACMAANLNGRYYFRKYKGVRDGIYWGAWHNISTEYYLTNERHSFKTVKMMIRPKGF